MLKPFLVVPALLVLGAPALLCQDQSTAPPQAATEFKVPADLITKINPIKPTTESQTKAKNFYGWDCAMCHGDKGDGKGDVAADQKITVRDFRDPASLSKMSDGEIFYIIQKGKGQMPGDGDRENEDMIWNMVILLRKMSNTQAPATAAPSTAPAQTPTTPTTAAAQSPTP